MDIQRKHGLRLFDSSIAKSIVDTYSKCGSIYSDNIGIPGMSFFSINDNWETNLLHHDGSYILHEGYFRKKWKPLNLEEIRKVFTGFSW